jgi:hypothetical protein
MRIYRSDPKKFWKFSFCSGVSLRTNKLGSIVFASSYRVANRNSLRRGLSDI